MAIESNTIFSPKTGLPCCTRYRGAAGFNPDQDDRVCKIFKTRKEAVEFVSNVKSWRVTGTMSFADTIHIPDFCCGDWNQNWNYGLGTIDHVLEVTAPSHDQRALGSSIFFQYDDIVACEERGYPTEFKDMACCGRSYINGDEDFGFQPGDVGQMCCHKFAVSVELDGCEGTTDAGPQPIHNDVPDCATVTCSARNPPNGGNWELPSMDIFFSLFDSYSGRCVLTPDGEDINDPTGHVYICAQFSFLFAKPSDGALEGGTTEYFTDLGTCGSATILGQNYPIYTPYGAATPTGYCNVTIEPEEYWHPI